MKITKKIARKIVFPTMMKFRFDKILRNISSNSILNIMYHGVVQEDSNYFSPRNIKYDQFEEQLIYLKKNFDIISLQDAFEMINKKIKTKRKTITISFDDGFQNNLYTALPLIEKHEVPVTFFISSVCTQEMKTRCLWPEKSAALKFFYRNEKISVGQYSFENFIETKKNININDLIKSFAEDERDNFLSEITEKYELDKKLNELPEEVWKLMTINELKQLSESKFVQIGSHGRLHYNLGQISLEKAKNELILSKELLEKAIGKEINMIAYPDGSYTNEIKQIAENVGYKYQLAVNYKEENDKKDYKILNRHGVSSGTTFDSNIIFINLAYINKGIKI